MEKKRFGVKNFHIEKLMQFQLSLKSRKETMPYVEEIEIRGNRGRVRQRVAASTRRISIEGKELNSWHLPRQTAQLSEEMLEKINQAPQEGETQNEARQQPFQLYYVATIVLSEYMEVSFLFNKFEERALFLGELGDLDATSSEEEDDPIES